MPLPFDQVSLWNIAHRGARSLAPENTLAAAQKAYEAGADMWELDVALSADGELIVIHDSTLERTSDARERYPSRKPWSVAAFTSHEIHGLDFGSWFVEQDPFGTIRSGELSATEAQAYRGLQAPTLGEALTFTRERDWFVNLEIKDLSRTPGDAVVVSQVVALIREMRLEDRVLVSSFNHGYLKQVKALEPALSIGALTQRKPPQPLALLGRLRAQSYHPRTTAIGLHEIARIRSSGYAVLVWVANGPQEMQRFIEAGVTGLFTDYPQRLTPLLGRAPQRRDPA